MERKEEEESLLCKSEADPIYIYTTCLEKCCSRGMYHLTSEELEGLNLLRRRVNIPFDKGNSLHNVSITQDLLRSLWLSVYGDQPLPSNMHSDKWMEIGFQSYDPTTDFRGAGLFGLQQIVYIVTMHSEQFKKLLKESEDYLLAISCINITVLYKQNFLIFYFQANIPGTHTLPEVKLAPARILKCFAALNCREENVLNEMFVIAVLKMHSIWLDMKSRPEVTLMNFREAIQKAMYYLEDLLEYQPKTLAELRSRVTV